MKVPKWICSLCKQTLTRKWNAIRHCNTQHDGICDSIISFREYLMITSKTYPNLSPNVHSYKTNRLPYQENMFFQDKSSFSNPQPHLRLAQEDSLDDFKKKEILLSNSLDKIAPKYEEIGQLLSHIPEPKENTDSRKYFK